LAILIFEKSAYPALCLEATAHHLYSIQAYLTVATVGMEETAAKAVRAAKAAEAVGTPAEVVAVGVILEGEAAGTPVVEVEVVATPVGTEEAAAAETPAVEVGVVMEAGEKVVVMEEMAGAAVRPVATGIA
jgi:hypothetical protein